MANIPIEVEEIEEAMREAAFSKQGFVVCWSPLASLPCTKDSVTITLLLIYIVNYGDNKNIEK